MKKVLMTLTILILLACGAGVQAVDLGSGLIAYWSFDDLGSLGNDDSGNGHHLAVEGAVSATGVIGNSLDTRNGYAAADSHPDLDLTGHYSVAAYFRRDSVVNPGDNPVIVAKHAVFTNNDGSWDLQAAASNLGDPINVEFREYASSYSAASHYYSIVSGEVWPPLGTYDINWGTVWDTSDPLLAGQWMHVAVTFDGTTAAIYVNGQLIRSGPWVSGLMNNDAKLQVGTNHLKLDGTLGGSNHFFQGDIDELRLYDRALSESDIAALAGINPAQEIVDFIDESVEEGAIVPVKGGKPGAGQLNALISMLWTAYDLIDAEIIADACGQLSAALAKTDGLAPPDSAPDFVTGPAAPELADMIEALMADLGCE